MIECRIEKGACRSSSNGNILELAADITLLVDGMYRTFKRTDELLASAFLSAVRYGISEEGGMVGSEGDSELISVCIPKKKEGDDDAEV